MGFKVGDRVITKYGGGEITGTEGPYGTVSDPWFRYIVNLDNKEVFIGWKVVLFFPHDIKKESPGDRPVEKAQQLLAAELIHAYSPPALPEQAQLCLF